MPKLFTNSQRRPTFPTATTGFCVSSYQEYVGQRVVEANVPAENIRALTLEYKTRIADPLHVLNPDLEMGEYFVIVVEELKKMLDSPDAPEFIQVCNALRKTNNTAGVMKTFPVAILVPVKKVTKSDGTEAHEQCESADSVYLESYPCPPDPQCPNTTRLHSDLIFDPAIKINDFQSLK